MTEPWVPTGMNMGVSQGPWGRVILAVRARPLCAKTSKDSAGEVLEGSAAAGGDVGIVFGEVNTAKRGALGGKRDDQMWSMLKCFLFG